MLRNDLTTALRALRRHPSYSVINVVGLAVGIATCLLISLFVRHELSYDTFHEDADRIHRLVSDWGDTAMPASTWPTINSIQEQNPSLELAPFFETRAVVHRNTKQFNEDPVFVARPSFFEVFTFPTRRGSAREAFSRPYTAVLTPAMADKYFGDAHAVGKTLQMTGLNGGDRTVEVTVAGVLAPLPEASHFHPQIVVSWATMDAAFNFTEAQRESSGGGFRAYLKVPDGTAPDSLAATFTEQAKARRGDDWRGATLRLQPLTDIHLYSDLSLEIEPNGSAAYVALFVAIALFILLLAGMNVVNLSTARAVDRAQEIGVRKTIGADRSQLIRQFLAEAAVLVGSAGVLAVGLAAGARPLIRSLTGMSLSFGTFADPYTLLTLSGIALVTTLGAGSYPAFVLSRFDPARVLGGSPGVHRARGPGTSILRRGLVVFQCATAVVLVAGTIAAYWQLDYLQDADLGFDAEQVVTVPQPPAADAPSISRSFRRDVAQHPGVTAVSEGSEPMPGDLQASVRVAVSGLGVAPEERHKLRLVTVGQGFFKTLGVAPIAGRTFEWGRPADSSGVVLNRAAAERLLTDLPPDRRTLEAALGQQLDVNVGFLGRDLEVIGIVDNFHLATLHQRVEPMAFFLTPILQDTYYLRVDLDETVSGLAGLQEVWQRYFPNAPFAYEFADQSFAAAYRSDQRVAILLGVFAGLAVLVAGLGLFGLAAFAARQRQHEIGVRKAVGASAGQIVGLISKDFLRLVGIAIAVAIPLSYVALTQWLNTFAYHFDLGLGVLLWAGTGVLLVALLTVSVQALRAARIDPATVLRNE
ncbi:putative ABC transport system permease protein [Salinibacter ruber]|uniref:ABC transporter permease n=1 Tax=Salinibacter ruber TaxID=146919 RepID=UPI00216A51A6|nr:ABC transporter permease [Salinibacter ruber]MCS3860307.1 putative ABC transport system permease protein [Salinibacter ruber]